MLTSFRLRYIFNYYKIYEFVYKFMTIIQSED